jgi:hypothetical protein
MKNGSATLTTKEARLALAQAIQRHLDMRGLARKDLIRDYLSKATIDKVFQGEFSERTLTKIEGILKATFAVNGHDDERRAPNRLGGYSYESVEKLIGDYLCVRPMFSDNVNLSAYLIAITWNERERCLCFAERARHDDRYTKDGQVSIPLGLPFLNLISEHAGVLRTILLSHPDHAGICRGIISTLSNPKGAIYIPVAAPIFLRRLAAGEAPETGLVTPKATAYAGYVKELATVAAEEYGVFVGVPGSGKLFKRNTIRP